MSVALIIHWKSGYISRRWFDTYHAARYHLNKIMAKTRDIVDYDIVSKY